MPEGRVYSRVNSSVTAQKIIALAVYIHIYHSFYDKLLSNLQTYIPQNPLPPAFSRNKLKGSISLVYVTAE
jgi:hypothetical protein